MAVISTIKIPPHCKEKGARKYASNPNISANNKLKKITYQPAGDNKAANQVAMKKKSGFTSIQGKGRSNSVRPRFQNKKKVRYVQVVEEASSEEELSENEIEGDEGEMITTVANVTETPVCYGWSDADANLLGQSIFGVTNPPPSPSPSEEKSETHTTNLQNVMSGTRPNEDLVSREEFEASSRTVSPTKHFQSETISTNTCEKSSGIMPEKEKSSMEKQTEVVLDATAGQGKQESRPSTPYPAPPQGGSNNFVKPAEKRRRPVPVYLPPLPPTWGPEGMNSSSNPLTVSTSHLLPAVDPTETERDAKS